jgi:hypothetical protein
MAKETKQEKKAYRKDYLADKKAIAMLVSKEEAESWKHDLGLGPLARQLMRAYFAGKIQIDL